MKVYLDTSVLSALFDARKPERQELTKEFFSRIHEHEAFISELTRFEIEETPDEELRDNMRGVIADFHVLPSQEAVEQLSREYVKQGAVSEKYPEDADHIAVAVATRASCYKELRRLWERPQKRLMRKSSGR